MKAIKFLFSVGLAVVIIAGAVSIFDKPVQAANEGTSSGFWLSGNNSTGNSNSTNSTKIKSKSNTASKDLMKELQDKYPDCTVVDGQSDNDVIFEEVCEAIEAHETKLIIINCKSDIFNGKRRKFDAVSDFKYFYLKNMNVSVKDGYSIVNLTYSASSDEIESMISKIDSVYRDIQYDTMHYTSEWEIAEYVYNYLVREVTYDHSLSGANIRNIYGALVEKSAVCAGYAAAFDYIMSRLGYQVGVAGNADHAWNYIYWNSPDVFLDATWGDPDTYDMYSNHYINMSYMAFDAYEMETLDDHEISYCYISGRGYDDADVDHEEFYEGKNACDYCDVSGYNAGTYSFDAVERIFRSQYDRNENSLIVKFNSTYELHAAVNALTENNCAQLIQLYHDLGYYGASRWSYNENLKTFFVYIKVQ